MLRRRQALLQDGQKALAVAAKQRFGIEPQAGKYIGAVDAVRTKRQLTKLAAATNKPVNKLLPQCDHQIFTDTGFLVVLLLGMEINGFGALTDLGDQLRGAVEITLLILPSLSAALGKYEKAAVGLRL